MSIDESDGRDASSETSGTSGTTRHTGVRRVVVVDDHELLRAGTRRILDEATGFTVVGEAGDGGDALRVIAETSPDVVLVDIRLPNGNGIDLAREVVRDFPT